MILGRVVGHVWATRKHAKIARVRLLLVRPYFWYNPPHETGHVVAVDLVGAGPGEDVIVCLGEPARRTLGDANAPVEASVMAIVDRVEMRRETFGARGLRTLDGEIPERWLPPERKRVGPPP